MGRTKTLQVLIQDQSQFQVLFRTRANFRSGLLSRVSQCLFPSLKNPLVDPFSPLPHPFVDRSGFLAVFSVVLVGSLLKFMRSAPRSGQSRFFEFPFSPWKTAWWELHTLELGGARRITSDYMQLHVVTCNACKYM